MKKLMYWGNDKARAYALLPVIMIYLTAINAGSPDAEMMLSDYEVDNSGPAKIEGMKLVWNDEFDYTGKPNPNNWVYETGFVRNNELQWYQSSNANCRDGKLVIEGRREKIMNPMYNENSSDWRFYREFANYTSACIKTVGLQEWTGEGYYEIRARIDTAKGSWPAIWALGTKDNWPRCGEIDIMEYYLVDNEPSILANLAWGTEQRYRAKWSSVVKPLSEITKDDPDWTDKFHIWSMNWTSDRIQLFLDGELFNETLLQETVNADGFNPFKDDNTYYILLNLAIGSNGGDPSATEFPLTYEVDYVRVYKPVK